MISNITHHKIDKFGRSSFWHIHYPVSFSFSKFTPVLNPAFYSAYPTFYVQTLPTGFIEYGHPPNPPIDESTTRQPYIVALKMFYIAVSKVSWKWTANLSIGSLSNDENKESTF